MSAAHPHSTSGSTVTSVAVHRAAYGVVAGLAGGVIFGLLMQVVGMIPMVAMLVGSESTGVGWLLHLGISALFGAGFGLALGAVATRVGPAVAAGLGYGVLWWVLGALLIMPARLGMGLFVLNTTAWQSLMGHLVYGAVLALVFLALTRRD